MNKLLQRTAVALFLMASLAMSAQKTITGVVLEAGTQAPLPGANVYIEGANRGVVTANDGSFSIQAPTNNVTLKISFVGFKTQERVLKLTQPVTNLGNIALEEGASLLTDVEVVSSRANAEAPFTYTDLSKKEISQNLGSRDLPNVLNITPSVYSTNQGGGAGDSRINVRGFNQINVAVMINGVPVNDMENGWVYWSNWDGLGDAAASIQVQRGISPVNISVPSVGGTINIITDPAAQAQSVTYRQEGGSWNFRKTTIGFNSGLINDKFALSANIVRKTGDGFYQGTYTDAWAYYLGASYKIGKNDRLELSAIGAPQRHGQNLYMQNIARYDQEYAASLDGYDPAAFDKFREAGRNFNQNYGGVSPTYEGAEYYQMYNTYMGSRYSPNFLMERENYYHKPQVNLNWYHTFSEKLLWANIVYWSGGKGGGSGTFGSVSADYSFQGMGVRQWDAEVAQNAANVDSAFSATERRSTGVMRNSVNQQNTFGAISRLVYSLNDNLDLQVGVDYRTATIHHWREVRDLLGGDYLVFDGNDFESTNDQFMKRLGDKIDYNNTNKVNWIGGYAQAQYTGNKLSLFGMAGYTGVKYDYTDHFTNDGNGGELNIQTANLPGYQFKAGANYKIRENLSVYLNGGYISRNPIFDYAINDGSGVAYEDPENEKITTVEAGATYYLGNRFGITANYYNTLWSDRTLTQPVRTQSGDEDFIFIGGLQQRHSGVEVTASYQLNQRVRFDAGGSFGNWVFTDDVTATYTTYTGGSPVDTSFNLYVKDLKVGDAPQTQLYVSASVEVIKNLTLKADYRYYTNFYSNFNALDRTDEGDRVQSWKVPNYGVMDLHLFYDLPLSTSDFSVSLFAHVFNALDEVYIQDAVDNSQFNAFDGDHDADDAEVFFGLPRNFNAGFVIRF